MKKIYIKPVVEFEFTEQEDLMTASNPGNANVYVGEGYTDNSEFNHNIGSTGDANDDDFDMGAKGSFAFNDDFDYSF